MSNKKRDQFTEAYQKYFILVYNTIYTKIGNIEDTEDICHNIFILFYQKIESIEHHRRWLLGTIKNFVMKYYRDKKEFLDIENNLNDLSLTFINGFNDARIMLNDIIEKAISNDQERTLVECIAFHNYSYEHVAKLTGLTRKAVTYRYNKIVHKIICILKEKGIKNIEDVL